MRPRNGEPDPGLEPGSAPPEADRRGRWTRRAVDTTKLGETLEQERWGPESSSQRTREQGNQGHDGPGQEQWGKAVRSEVLTQVPGREVESTRLGALAPTPRARRLRKSGEATSQTGVETVPGEETLVLGESPAQEARKFQAKGEGGIPGSG